MKQRLQNVVSIALLLFFAITAKGQTGVAPTAGDGSQGSPYQIATLENLIWVQEQTAGTDNWSENKFFEQTADIDLISIDNWTPIGTGNPGGSSPVFNRSFRGTYDGANFSIRNLRINRDNEYQGLFGFAWVLQ